MKTQPLPPGNYDFTFHSSDTAGWEARLYIDNIKFEYLDINSSFEPVDL
jgi:hypothetical protein